MNQEEAVFHTIEKAIFEQRLPPGTRLREIQLAAIFDVKRGLIRKVLTRLTNRKLVDHKPHAGAQVACPSLKDAKDLFATRLLLENSVIKILCVQITPQQIAVLRSQVKQEKLAYMSSDVQKGVSLSAGFHKLLAQFAGNLVIEEYLNDIISRTPLVMLSRPGLKPHEVKPHNVCVNHDHNEIIDALVARDSERASDLMRQHLSELEDMFEIEPQKKAFDLIEVFAQ